MIPICSTYCAENDRVYDGSSRKGLKIISFAPILKTKIFPLPDIVKFLLRLCSEGLNCPVEIEFAVNLDTEKDQPKEFYFLQVRPMIKETQVDSVELSSVSENKIIAKSYKTLGNFNYKDIHDVIIVTPDKFDRGKTIAIASEVGKFNKKLKNSNKPYLLIGPGRWGTTERWLGVPVTWDQISGAKVIMEAAYGDFAPDPSFGTHFFQNLTSFQTGYFTINPNTNNGFLDFDWLLSQNIVEQTEFITHINLDKPLNILIDGQINSGIIAKN